MTSGRRPQWSFFTRKLDAACKGATLDALLLYTTLPFFVSPLLRQGLSIIATLLPGASGGCVLRSADMRAWAEKTEGREPHRTPVVPVIVRGGISRSRLALTRFSCAGSPRALGPQGEPLPDSPSGSLSARRNRAKPGNIKREAQAKAPGQALKLKHVRSGTV
jgi:hypothetical protein